MNLVRQVKHAIASREPTQTLVISFPYVAWFAPEGMEESAVGNQSVESSLEHIGGNMASN